MNIVLPKPGMYVVAVSGGVDSMVLLDVLRRQRAQDGAWKLVVAHLDHGVREDSAEDRRLVQRVARRHGVPFVYQAVELGKGVSEATARAVRYEFLHQVRRASGARAVLTAHHQDDALETAIINLLRGTGRKGLTALASRHDLERPLLAVPKSELVDYAHRHDLAWREDSTNADEAYLRNYVRRRLLQRFDQPARAELWRLISQLRVTNRELDGLLSAQLHQQVVGGTLERPWFNRLPHAVAREVLAAWLTAHGVRGWDRKTLERLVVAAKVAPAGRVFPVLGGTDLQVSKDRLALAIAER